MIAIRNGILRNMFSPRTSHVRDSSDYSTGWEVSFCFQSICGFLGKVILTAQDWEGCGGKWHRNGIWRIEPFRISKQAKLTAPGKSNREAKISLCSNWSAFPTNRFISLAAISWTLWPFTDFLRCQKYTRRAESGGRWGNGRGKGRRVSQETRSKNEGAWGCSETTPLIYGCNHTVASGSDMPRERL